jgi:hypothetical protein
MGGKAIFVPCFGSLAKHFRLVVIDVPGMGLCDRPAFKGTTAEDAEMYFATQLEQFRIALLADHGLPPSTKVWLLGHSYGTSPTHFCMRVIFHSFIIDNRWLYCSDIYLTLSQCDISINISITCWITTCSTRWRRAIIKTVIFSTLVTSRLLLNILDASSFQ